jgi:hypothetical protein
LSIKRFWILLQREKGSVIVYLMENTSKPQRISLNYPVNQKGQIFGSFVEKKIDKGKNYLYT